METKSLPKQSNNKAQKQNKDENISEKTCSPETNGCPTIYALINVTEAVP